jgi:hypothetical protein
MKLYLNVSELSLVAINKCMVLTIFISGKNAIPMSHPHHGHSALLGNPPGYVRSAYLNEKLNKEVYMIPP